MFVTTFLLLAAAAAEPSAAPPDEAERKICRSTFETGSHIIKHKTCLTKGEWDRQRLIAGREFRDGRGAANREFRDAFR